MITNPETPQTKPVHSNGDVDANANAANSKKPFARHEGDKQIVNGIGDTGDEEQERHNAQEHNKVSRTKE